jgi:hypothetical protein
MASKSCQQVVYSRRDSIAQRLVSAFLLLAASTRFYELTTTATKNEYEDEFYEAAGILCL